MAAVVSAMYPVPDPILEPAPARATSQDSALAALDDAWSPIDESEPSGGPLEVPSIGVVVDDYDERYAALEAARAAEEAAEEDLDHGIPPVDDHSAEEQQTPTDRDAGSPDVPPENQVGTPPSAPVPAPAVVSPAVEPPVAQSPAAPRVTDPAPSSSPSSSPSPSTASTPPTEPAPPTEAPTQAPSSAPEETTLAFGQRYEYRDADGNVDFTITLVSVEADLACTAPGSLPAENGRLIGLHVEVSDPTPPAQGEPPSLDAADFRFVGDDGVVTADVSTDSSSACLDDGWPSGQPGPDAPVMGTLVLDLPATTGTVVYRPDS